jgi:hypothetical protein
LWDTNRRQSPFVTDLFFAGACGGLRSTGNKQTLNGLFYLIAKKMFPSTSAFQRSFFPPSAELRDE